MAKISALEKLQVVQKYLNENRELLGCYTTPLKQINIIIYYIFENVRFYL